MSELPVLTDVTEILYGSDKGIVRPATNAVIKPTLIQSFDGTVTLHYKKDGQLEKRGFQDDRTVEPPILAMETANAFCLSELGMKPIIFEKGWIQANNGHKKTE